VQLVLTLGCRHQGKNEFLSATRRILATLPPSEQVRKCKTKSGSKRLLTAEK
jgi:hypothetical protein